jgi:hypothetical protein
MIEADYCVICCEDGSFAVEVTRAGELTQTAIRFETEAEASAWVAQDKKLWQAADPFRVPARRNRGRL